ncbi:YpfB family protein [Bacillus thuringiensis]|nr:YpfB family protein [Bacillus thuringiensis]
MKKMERIFIRILIIQFVKYLSKIVYYEGVMVKNKVEILQVNR